MFLGTILYNRVHAIAEITRIRNFPQEINLGIAAGVFVSLAIAFVPLRLAYATAFGPLLAVVVLSAVLGHIAWHWRLGRAHELEHQLGHAAASGLSAALLQVAFGRSRGS